MIDNQPTTEAPAHPTRKISIRERSVRIGDVIVVNAYRVNRTLLKQRFAEGAYQAYDPPHFLLFTREAEPKTVLVHWFKPEDFHTNIPRHLVVELKPFGIITSNRHLGELMTGIVGGTLFPDDVRRAWNYFEERHLTNVRYVQADLLADDFSTMGTFDTVTALHMLEHFTEEDMYRVLTNLLKMTVHRLILAVPYETSEPEAAYGHLQLFSRAKLEAVGARCIEQPRGAARMWYEDLPRSAGLLLIEKLP